MGRSLLLRFLARRQLKKPQDAEGDRRGLDRSAAAPITPPVPGSCPARAPPPHHPTVPLACHPTPLSPEQVPTNRLLLESDREQSGCVEEDLEKMLLVMGDAKGLLGDEILHVTTANALTFYGYEGGESAADRW